MVKRKDKRRWRRVLILALFLLIPALLSDLPLFSKTGHGHGATPAAGLPGGAELALLPIAPDAFRMGHGWRHWHAAGTDGDLYEGQGEAQDALLHNLVYLTGDEESPNGNAPLSDGGSGGNFGGDDGGHGGGGGGGPTGFGGPGYDPGTEILPLAFTPDDGNGDKGDNGGGDKPPFFSPAGPSIAAVPEPATWALFILGFGLLGAQLRRARDAELVTSRSGRH